MSSSTATVFMSQSQMNVLDDKEVSRRMAEKAVHDQAFKDQLLICVNPHTQRKGYRAILKTIKKFREQILDEAELKIPEPANGKPRDVNTYLKRATKPLVSLGKAIKQEGEETKVTSVEVDGVEWGWVGTPMCIARLAEIFLQSTLRFQADPTPFPFERLPPELRLQVYREAVGGAACGQFYQKTVSSAVRRRVNPDDTIMVIPFRTKKKGLQFWFGHPPKGESREINLGILAASRLTHDEAIAVLYQFRNFDFGLSINGVVPFLRSLSQHARENLSGITMDLHDKWEPRLHKGPDNQADWSRACIYIGENVNLKTLSISVNVKVDAGFRDLKWVKDLVKIKNLRYLTLQVIQHHSIGPVPVIASDKDGSLLATEDSVNEHLVPFWCFLREQMLE